MRLTAFETHVRDTIPLGEDGKQLSLADFAKLCGVSTSYLYRRFRETPWLQKAKDRKFFQRLSQAITDPMDKLLWFAGYNPFVGRGLSLRELHLLFEIMLKLTYNLQHGTFDGNLGKLTSLASNELAALANARKEKPECESS